MSQGEPKIKLGHCAARAKRDKRVAKAQAMLEKSQRAHEERAESLEAERTAIEKRIQAEDARWESEKEKLTARIAASELAGKTELTIRGRLRKKFREGLETFSGVLNSFGVAIAAAGTPSGSCDLRRAPVVSGASYPSCSLEDLAMRTYDFSPLFRSTIGFDRLFDLAETAQRAADEGYPPYNIERLAEDRYQITLAVAGFSPDEISITAEQNVVTIEGGKTDKTEREFLYRGISTRHFKRQFNLADYVQVKGATFDNGLLKIELVREIPEAMKPRRIAISGTSPTNVTQIESKAA